MSLYLVPATRANLECSIENDVAPSKLSPHVAPDTLAEIQARAGVEGIRCWAMTASRKSSFEEMRPGDIVLLSESDTKCFTHYAEVTCTLENKALGDALWPFQSENPWEFIYFLRNIQRIRIPKPEFVTKLGYKPNYDVPGTVRVTSDRIQRFESAHGPLEEWFGIPYAHEEFASLLGELHDGTGNDYSSSNVMGLAMRRLKHAKFAAQVKANYEEACAMCGVTEKGFLAAGHIVAWSEDEKNRVNPANGLYLCVLHDRAFERGYLVLDEKLFIRMNPRISPTTPLGMLLTPVNGLRLRLPLKDPPAPEFLKRHRDRFPFSVPK